MIFISRPSPIYMRSILLGQVSLLMNLISTPSHFHNDPTELLLTAEEPVLILDLINKQRDLDPVLWFNQSTTWVDWASERSYKAQQGMTQGHLDLALPTTIPTLWSIASALWYKRQNNAARWIQYVIIHQLAGSDTHSEFTLATLATLSDQKQLEPK